MTNISVRLANPNDAPEIANVHVNAWRETYQKLLPQEYIDSLPIHFRLRMNRWKEALEDINNSPVFVAEHGEHGIIGFSSFCEARDESMQKFGELAAIYLMKKFQGIGVGYDLLKIGLSEMKNKGFKQFYCWVLENNPTISFYERTGATKTDKIKHVEFAGVSKNELLYTWKNLTNH